MAYWGGDIFQTFQTLDLSGQILSLNPGGGSVTLPMSGDLAGVNTVAQISTLRGQISTIDTYLKAINDALIIEGAAYP